LKEKSEIKAIERQRINMSVMREHGDVKFYFFNGCKWLRCEITF